MKAANTPDNTDRPDTSSPVNFNIVQVHVHAKKELKDKKLTESENYNLDLIFIQVVTAYNLNAC